MNQTHTVPGSSLQRGSRAARAHRRFLDLAQGARRNPDARRLLRAQGHAHRPAAGRSELCPHRSPCRHGGRLAGDPRRHPRARGHADRAAGLRSSCRPTWTGLSRKASTARPTTAPRCASRASGSRSRTRKWTAASWSIPRSWPPAASRWRMYTRAIGSWSAGKGCGCCRRKRRPGTACSSSWPARFPAKSPRA